MLEESVSVTGGGPIGYTSQREPPQSYHAVTDALTLSTAGRSKTR